MLFCYPCSFVDLPNPFEQEIVDNLFKDFEHQKTKHPYVEPQVKDAQTIETETETTNSEFPKLKQEFDKVNNAAERKSQTDTTNLTDDDYDTQTIRNILKEVIDVAEPIETITVTGGNDKFNLIETTTIEDNIGMPSDDVIAIDIPEKVKITTTN